MEKIDPEEEDKICDGMEKNLAEKACSRANIVPGRGQIEVLNTNVFLEGGFKI